MNSSLSLIGKTFSEKMTLSLLYAVAYMYMSTYTYSKKWKK